MRTVVLHYHLFKNAGTSLDQILRKNFGDRLVKAEFLSSLKGNTEQVEAWIADTPEAVAYTSHTMMGPLPRVRGVRIIPVILLRDPIARIRSAYQFERNQDAETWGAELAKKHDLEGYVRARLARDGDRQCRNFQTSRLATLTPSDAPELERAIASARAIQKAGVLGRVEDFAKALEDLTKLLKPEFSDFQAEAVRANVSKKSKDAVANAALDALLQEANQDDMELLSQIWK